MSKENILKLVVSIVICQTAGIIGSLFTTPYIPTWYATLVKPDFNPPSWVFGPVWTTLYLLMGIALFLVWKNGFKNKNVPVAMAIFGVQLILNTAWSIIFFRLQNPGLAFIEMVFLWASILASMIYFYKVSKIASWLLLPYILWVSFAGVLNMNIWLLN